MSEETFVLRAEDLEQFIGTENWYRHWTKLLLYTDGVSFLAEAGKCFWLIDLVASYQTEPKYRKEEFQVWKLTINRAEHTGKIICEDGNDIQVFHARDDEWRKRTYRYIDLIQSIKQGALRDKAVYQGELTVLDERGIGRHNLFGRRQLEGFQITRCSKIYPIVFFVHHVLQDNEETLFQLTYEQQLTLLSRFVKPDEHIRLVPTFRTPEPLYEMNKEKSIEGIIINESNRTYLRGKRGNGHFKFKFLKEEVVKFIGYEEQKTGIKMFSDGNPSIEVHLAGDRVSMAVASIDEKGMLFCEVEYLEKTINGMLRNPTIKRLLTDKKEEI